VHDFFEPGIKALISFIGVALFSIISLISRLRQTFDNALNFQPSTINLQLSLKNAGSKNDIDPDAELAG
jgi:hypothetical protein